MYNLEGPKKVSHTSSQETPTRLAARVANPRPAGSVLRIIVSFHPQETSQNQILPPSTNETPPLGPL